MSLPPAKDIHVLFPRSCAYIALHGKRESRMPMKLGLLIT